MKIERVKGEGFVVLLTETIDTTSAGGCLVFHMITALEEFKRSLIVERTQAGLVVAKSRGVKLGPKKKLIQRQIEHGRALLTSGGGGHAVAQNPLGGVSRATLYRALGPTA